MMVCERRIIGLCGTIVRDASHFASGIAGSVFWTSRFLPWSCWWNSRWTIIGFEGLNGGFIGMPRFLILVLGIWWDCLQFCLGSASCWGPSLLSVLVGKLAFFVGLLAHYEPGVGSGFEPGVEPGISHFFHGHSTIYDILKEERDELRHGVSLLVFELCIRLLDAYCTYSRLHLFTSLDF